MRACKLFLLIFLPLAIAAVFYGIHLERRGFSAREQPSAIEALVAIWVLSTAEMPENELSFWRKSWKKG